MYKLVLFFLMGLFVSCESLGDMWEQRLEDFEKNTDELAFRTSESYILPSDMVIDGISYKRGSEFVFGVFHEGFIEQNIEIDGVSYLPGVKFVDGVFDFGVVSKEVVIDGVRYGYGSSFRKGKILEKGIILDEVTINGIDYAPRSEFFRDNFVSGTVLSEVTFEGIRYDRESEFENYKLIKGVTLEPITVNGVEYEAGLEWLGENEFIGVLVNDTSFENGDINTIFGAENAPPLMGGTEVYVNKGSVFRGTFLNDYGEGDIRIKGGVEFEDAIDRDGLFLPIAGGGPENSFIKYDAVAEVFTYKWVFRFPVDNFYNDIEGLFLPADTAVIVFDYADTLLKFNNVIANGNLGLGKTENKIVPKGSRFSFDLGNFGDSDSYDDLVSISFEEDIELDSNWFKNSDIDSLVFKGGTEIEFDENENISVGILASAGVVNNIRFSEGSILTFSRYTGFVTSGILDIDTSWGNIVLAGGSLATFDDDGNLLSGVLGEDAKVNGRWLDKGTKFPVNAVSDNSREESRLFKYLDDNGYLESGDYAEGILDLYQGIYSDLLNSY